MMMQRLYSAALIAGLGQALIGGVTLADESAETTSEQAITESLETIIFVPHDVGAPETTDAGGVRSISTAPRLTVLAPARTTLTLSASPTLYWYVSKPMETPVRFTLHADDSSIVDPLLDLDLGVLEETGIYALPLADYGVRLEGKHRYAWAVTAASAEEGATSDPIPWTWIEHSPSAGMASFLETSPPFDRTARLASQGYWYDAIDLVSRQIVAGDPSVPWRKIRASLLDQVGLRQAAAFDRRAMQ